MTPRRRRQARGNALILAVLIMFAMLGLGMVALRSTSQAIASSGNTRLTQQARAVAEAGLYHVATLMNRNGLALLNARKLWAEGAVIQFDSDGVVQFEEPGGQVRPGPAQPVPAVFVAAPGADPPPPALGDFERGSGLRPSYRVTVDGLRQSAAAGTSGTNHGQTFVDCTIELQATGYVARENLPTADDLNAANVEEQYAEQRLKAVIRLRSVPQEVCVR